LATGCTDWYSGASQKYASDVEDMVGQITKIEKHKHIIMNYAKPEFHSVKGHLFDIVDALIDSQRDIVSVDDYFQGRIKYINKRISATPWKFQLKYGS